MIIAIVNVQAGEEKARREISSLQLRVTIVPREV